MNLRRRLDSLEERIRAIPVPCPIPDELLDHLRSLHLQLPLERIDQLWAECVVRSATDPAAGMSFIAALRGEEEDLAGTQLMMIRNVEE